MSLLFDLKFQYGVLFYPISGASPHKTSNGIGPCGWILVLASYLLVFITFPVSLCLCFKVSIYRPSFLIMCCCRLFRSMRGPSSLDWVGYSLGGPRAQVGNRISHHTIRKTIFHLRSSLHHALHREADSY